MNRCVVMPAFNEADNISNVIRDVKRFKIDIIVIDDGSTDHTSAVAAKEDAFILRHPKQQGKGTSLKDGFDYALSKGYDTVIIMDADGQHDAADINKFIDKADKTGSSIVIGNRMANPTGMPWLRIFTNRLMSSIISAICGQKIPDTQCGYRLLTKEALQNINLMTSKFEIESEILIKLARKGFRVESVPVRSIYANETSRIRPIRDTLRFIRFIAGVLLKGR